ncbi:dimethylnonatriene synthase-like [Corylus avellana]|uniref:dimethylnonatriene synthase-like n=1 Tax=Corylus avellana TaxID=13451 RepID=UPI001E228367|nr:dimethylnonatriene synthase-like [Corylus avellana]
MEIQTIVGLLALLAIFTHALLRLASHGKNGSPKLTGIPEPPGALPIIGHLFHLGGSDDPVARILGAMADKYGPLFSLRIGQRRLLVVSSKEMAKEFLATNDKVFATRASITFGKHTGYNNAIFALAPHGQYWREMRKMTSLELLSNDRLETQKHVPNSEVESMIKELFKLSEDNRVPTISEMFEHMAYNIILRKLVGKRFSAAEYREKSSEAGRIRSGISDALFLSGIFVLSDAIPCLEWMDFQGRVGSMKRAAKELDSVLDIWLQEHLHQKKLECKSNEDRDFMDVMLSTFEEDAVISGHTRDTIIKATTMILILTGSGSTAVTLTWAVTLLLNHPKVLKAAQEELDTHVGKDKWVQESDIKNLNYLRAIVKETLRLYPPGPLTGIREAMEDCNIGDCFVPKGTRVVINIWKLQRDPRVWENPSEFQPERFLTTHAEVDVRGQNFEFIPFSFGRRSCPGIGYGFQVLHLALARVLQGFDIATVGGMKVDVREGLGIALPKVEPLQLVLKPRLPKDLY